MRCALGTWDVQIYCNGNGCQRVDFPLVPLEGRKVVEGYPPWAPHPADFSLSHSELLLSRVTFASTLKDAPVQNDQSLTPSNGPQPSFLSFLEAMG